MVSDSDNEARRPSLPGRGNTQAQQQVPNANPALKMGRTSSRAPLNKSGKATNRSPTPRRRNSTPRRSKQAGADVQRQKDAAPPRRRSPNKAVYLSLAEARQHEAAEKTRLLPMPPSLPSSVEELAREKEQERAASRAYVKDRKVTGATSAELRDEGYTASELKEAGYTLNECWGAGFAAPELREAGFSPKAVKELGKLARRHLFVKQAQQQQQQHDQQPQPHRPVSSSIAEAASKAYPVRKQATPVAEVRGKLEGARKATTNETPAAHAAAVSPSTSADEVGNASSALHFSGVPATEALVTPPHLAAGEEGAARSAPIALSSAALAISQQRAAGASASDLRRAGFSAADLRGAGYGLQECWNAGFAKRLLVEAGFSNKEVKQIAIFARRAAHNAANSGTQVSAPASMYRGSVLGVQSSPAVCAM